MKRNIRQNVFISYSHKDRHWLNRLKIHLKPLEKSFKVDIWEDTLIRPGSKWREEIQKALDSAKVAILLISADFLASDFIASNELPPLLKAAENEGAIILPVIAKPSLFNYINDLSQFKAVNAPSESLISLPEGKQEEVFVKVAETLFKTIFNDTSTESINSKLDESSLLYNENFLIRDHWTKLIKIGDWIYDKNKGLFIGAGMNSYIISRNEYGLNDFSIRAVLKFSNIELVMSEFNAGFIFGWRSDKANPQYYNILITGYEIQLEKIGFSGGDAFSDYDHIATGGEFNVVENQFYDFVISFKHDKIEVILNDVNICSFKTPEALTGRVGLRPWRSQIDCKTFEILEEK